MGFLKTRSTQYSAYATVYILIVLALLGAVNYLANRYNKSFDATANKRYTLSDQTLKLARNLKQDVSIFYFDETTNFPRAKDLLDRYENLSPKLKVTYVDTYKKPNMVKQYGITQNGAIVLTSGSKREEARGLSEEELTSALVRLQKTGVKTVCFTAGAGEHSLEETTGTAYSAAKELIEKNNYKTESVNLMEKPEVPGVCSTLVVAGPKVDYPAPVVDALKKFVEGGGHALIMTDPPIQTAKERVGENAALADVLKGWGVTVNKDMILDTSGVGGLYGMGPEVALATKYETHPIVREMKRTATAFPLVRSLDVKPGDKTTAEKLVSTTKASIAATNLNLASGSMQMPKGETQSYAVAAAGTYRTGQQKDAQNVEGRFVVVGSSDFMANYAIGFAGNRDLALNMLNWLSSDEDLISIRPKDPEDRRIQLTRAQMLMVRMVSQFMIPLLVILFGVMVWWRRR
jgi:ABC-type uncharacterized transport system involved in gliding motility auxiliary subunit